MCGRGNYWLTKYILLWRLAVGYENRLSMRSHIIFVCLFIQMHGAAVARQAKPTVPEFGPQVATASLTIGSDKHNGYSAQFDFPPESLQKGWWKYLKTVARVKNRKTYWRLSVPPEKGSSTLPVEMFSAIAKQGSSSTLTLVLNAVNMDAATRKDYLQQTKNFLEEFKAKFYRDYVQQLIAHAEKRARKASKAERKAARKRLKIMASLGKLRTKSSGEEAAKEEKALLAELQLADQQVARKAADTHQVQEEIDFLKKALLQYVQKSDGSSQ